MNVFGKKGKYIYQWYICNHTCCAPAHLLFSIDWMDYQNIFTACQFKWHCDMKQLPFRLWNDSHTILIYLKNHYEQCECHVIACFIQSMIYGIVSFDLLMEPFTCHIYISYSKWCSKCNWTCNWEWYHFDRFILPMSSRANIRSSF